MNGASDDNAVHVGVVWLVCKDLDSKFKVDCPESQNHITMLGESVG